jgi:hypothetical protein
MAEHTIFGSGTPTLTASGDTGAVNVATAFYQVSGVPWEIRGLRFYVPAGTAGLAASGYSGYLFGGTVSGGKGVPSNTALATLTFPSTITAGQWNEARFASAVSMPSGSYFFASVYFPAGLYGAASNRFAGSSTQATDGSQLFAAVDGEINPGNGLYEYGTAGAPLTHGSSSWYGVDVIAADDLGGGAGSVPETVGITDSITVIRGGLPTAVNMTATATDTLGLTATDSLTATVAGATGATLVRRSIMRDRLIWGSIIDQGNKGPAFVDEATPMTGSVRFALQWHARITGGRVYKAPAYAGDMPVTLWSPSGEKLAETQITGLVADGGGWVDYRFPAAVDGIPGGLYTVSYYSANGIYAYTPWFWHAQDWVQPPFVVPLYKESVSAPSDGAAFSTQVGNVMPITATATCFYIDVDVEWYVTTPRYTSGRTYFDQWTNGQPAAEFPVGVFFADPPFLADYASIGVNTLVGGYLNDAYNSAVSVTGMDWYPTIDAADAAVGSITNVVDDATLGARVRGYLLGDEPDMVVIDPTVGWRSPQFFKDLRNVIRLIDSTRPVMLNLGKWPPLNMAWAWLPDGATPLAVNAYWRDYADSVDVLSSDFYNMTSDQSGGVFGIWTYPLITRRIMELSDGRTPVWGYVESTSQAPGEPTPAQVYSAAWAHVIAGARGVVFFDHRFADSDVTQDFAALLHDPAMRAQVQTLAAQLQSLGDVLFSPDADLVTAVASSGPMLIALGGYALNAKIPIHYTARTVGTTQYLFAQSIRPGTTTGTFTVPTAAGRTITVIGESRTVTANGAGVFSDLFATDYAVHLYSWTAAGGAVGTAPVNTAAPAVTGTATTGSTLTSTTGTWTGTATITYAYQWKRGGTNITGATASTYVLQVADVAQAIKCSVTATNGFGVAAADSNTVTPSAPATGDPLAALARIPWNGGPAYYSQFSKLAGTQWTSSAFFPIGYWGAYIDSATVIATYKTLGINMIWSSYNEVAQSAQWLRDNGLWYLGGNGLAGRGSEYVGDLYEDEVDMWAGPGWNPYNPATGAGFGSQPDNSRNGYSFMYYQQAQLPALSAGALRWWNCGKGVILWETENEAKVFINGGGTDPNTGTLKLWPLHMVTGDCYFYTDTNIASEAPTFLGVPSGQTRRASNYGEQILGLLRRYDDLDATRISLGAVVELGGQGKSNGLDMTADKIEGAVWSTLINEARCISYFSHAFTESAGNPFSSNVLGDGQPQYATHRARVQKINTEVIALAPALNTQSYVWTFNPNLDTMLKSQGGNAYIFAMQKRSATTSGTYTFTLPAGIPAAGTITVVGESRTIPYTGGAFSDNFAAEYSHHVYVLPL